MKTRYRHIHFVEIHKQWFCNNNRTCERLGMIEYYPPWKRYVFSAKLKAVFDISCLKDVMHFMSQL